MGRVAKSLPANFPKTIDEREKWEWFADSCSCGLPAGKCKKHHRARVAQRPPEGDWSEWLYLAGRGTGKSRAGAEWVRSRAEANPNARIALMAPTTRDLREVVIGGSSGLLAVCPPWFYPKYEKSISKLTFPNGAVCLAYTAEEPDRVRGSNNTDAWIDELSSFQYPDAYDQLLFTLRAGDDPRVCITTTPKATDLVKKVINKATTVKTVGSTYDNQDHLAPSFFTNVIESYKNTRLGRQEIFGEILELIDGVRFPGFDESLHVNAGEGEYHPAFGVSVAVDCGTSRTTGAVYYQCMQLDAYRKRIVVFGDYCVKGSYSTQNAQAIRDYAYELPCAGRIDKVRTDPAASAETGIGPAAFGQYEEIFRGILERWPSHPVADGLEQVELMLDRGCLIVHPRAKHLIEAFKNYRMKINKLGDATSKPVDPQNPHEDMLDSLRGAVRAEFPDGHRPGPSYRQVRASVGGY